MQIELEELNLSNLGDEHLERDLQESLADIGAAFSDLDNRFETNKGKMKAELTIKLTFEADESSKIVMFDGQITCKLPKRKAHGRGIRMEGGRFFTEPGQGDQESLPLRGDNVRDLPTT